MNLTKILFLVNISELIYLFKRDHFKRNQLCEVRIKLYCFYFSSSQLTVLFVWQADDEFVTFRSFFKHYTLNFFFERSDVLVTTGKPNNVLETVIFGEGFELKNCLLQRNPPCALFLPSFDEYLFDGSKNISNKITFPEKKFTRKILDKRMCKVSDLVFAICFPI